MPYIKKEQRDDFEDGLERTPTPDDAGELNYVLTNICKAYINFKGLNYKSINDCIGALECCKQELYRRVAAPYEDKKLKENGDV